MCRFKSGIILKNRIVLAQGENDSHTDLLEELKIEDNYENAIRVFVRAELIPPQNEWWTDPAAWEFCVDQDEVPDWFYEDREKYEKLFREEVKSWCEKHILIDKTIDELRDGYYRLKRCKVKKLCNDVKVLCDSSTVQRMCDNSTVQRMYGSSTVQEMCDNSTVQRMCDNSTVQRMYGSSTVQEMYDSSTVQEMYGSSTVQEMCDNSTVQRMYGSSTVQRMHGSSTVQEMYDSSIARDYGKRKIWTSEETVLEITIHKNK